MPPILHESLKHEQSLENGALTATLLWWTKLPYLEKQHLKKL